MRERGIRREEEKKRTAILAVTGGFRNNSAHNLLNH